MTLRSFLSSLTGVIVLLLGASALAQTAVVPYTQSGRSPNSWTPMQGCSQTAIYDTNTSGSTELVAAISGETIFVCGFVLVGGGTVNVKLIAGTGTACATGSHNLTPAWPLAVQTVVSDQAAWFRGIKTASSEALCVNASTNVAASLLVYYNQY